MKTVAFRTFAAVLGARILTRSYALTGGRCRRDRLPMRPRRVVLDQPSGIRAPARLETCPACGEAIADVARRRVDFAWRAPDGRHPQTFELRCRGCGQRVIAFQLGDGGLALVPDQASALAEVRRLGRERFDGDPPSK